MLSMAAQTGAVLLEGQPLVLLVQNDRVVLVLRLLADEEIDFLSGLLLAAGHDVSLQYNACNLAGNNVLRL